MARRVFIGYFALVLLATGALALILGQRSVADARAAVERRLEEQAVFLREIAAPQLPGGLDPGFESRLRELGGMTKTRLTVILADGRVIADSAVDPATMENHRARPEILEARARGRGTTVRQSQTTGIIMRYVAVAIGDGSALSGFARAACPETEVRASLGAMRAEVFLGWMLAVVLGGLASILVARRTLGPFSTLLDDVRDLAGGRRQGRIRDDEAGEIGELGRCVNRIVDRERDRMEAFLQDRSKLLAILGSMVEGVVAVDLDERIMHINEVAGRILGTPPERSAAKHIWEVTRSREVPMILAQALREGTEVTTEATSIGPSRDRLVELYASPLRDGEGEIAGAVVILHDITEIRRLEAVRRDFITNASHELKTPITAVRGFVETMIEDPEMPPDTRVRFLDRIREQSNRMSALVSDMLVLSRLESVGEEGERVPVDLAEIAGECVRVFRPVAETRGVTLDRIPPATASVVLARPEELREVAENLVDNAVKYTPAGGKIEVSTGTESYFAYLEVRDNGPGIAQQHHNRIFERFYRVDQARSRELGGTGLGLAIVKHIAQSLGGGVSVRSAPGAGSTFRVRIPLAPGESAAEGRGER